MLTAAYGDALVDHWFVYEWQGRGSVHVHALIWLSDAPQLPSVGDLATAQKKGTLAADQYEQHLREWANYYGQHSTAFNPAVIPRQIDPDAPEEPEPEPHPADPFRGRQREYERPYYVRPPVEQLPKLPLGRHICAHNFGDLNEDTDEKYLSNFCNRHIRC